LGTTNPINLLKATVNGLQRLRRPEEVARTRGLTVAQVLPVPKKRPEKETVEPVAAPEPTPEAEAPVEPVAAPEPTPEAEAPVEPIAPEPAAEVEAEPA